MKQNIQEVWDSYKKFNTNVMGIPEEERKRRKFEAIMTNFPKLSDSKPQIEEAQNTMQDKYYNKNPKAYHIHTAENER